MNDAEADSFVGGRFAELLAFYDAKAGTNKCGHMLGSAYVLVVSSLLGPLAAMNWERARCVTMALAPTVAVVTGLLALYQAHQNWLSYRAAWDALKREHSLWRARAQEYASAADANALFVERVEAIASSEGTSWYARQGERTRGAPPADHSTM
jgi:hypothetical protein